MKAKIVTKGIVWNSDINRILIVQRSSADSVGANTWENIGGNLEEGEDIEEGLIREIREEVGITDIAIRKVAYVALLNGASPNLIIVYLCETKSEVVNLSSEHQSYLWADEAECRNKLPKAILDDFEKNGIWRIFSSSGKDI